MSPVPERDGTQYSPGRQHREREDDDHSGEEGGARQGDFLGSWRQHQQRHCDQEGELLRKDRQSEQDAGRQPALAAGTCRGRQSQSQCEQVLRVKVRLHAHPHGQQTRDEEEGGGLPAAATPTGRPQPNDHSDHQRKPGHTSDPLGRIERTRVGIPLIHGCETLAATRPERCGRWEWHASSDPRHGCDTTGEKWVERRHRRVSRLDHRGVGARDLTMGNGPCAVDRLLRVKRRRPPEKPNQRNEQAYRYEPPEDTQPCGKRPVELVAEPRKPSAAVGSNGARLARLDWGRRRGEGRVHLTLATSPPRGNANAGRNREG